MLFLDLISRAPLPHDGARAADLLADLAKSPAADVLETVLRDGGGRALLEGAFDGSRFLGHAAKTSPDCLAAIFVEGPDAALAAAIAKARQAAEASSLQRAMAGLRRARLECALIVGLADLAGAWPTMRATAALSEMAEAAIGAATDWLLADAARRNVLAPSDGAAATDGFIVLGMGKLGARELNYSSDVDLILLFEPDRIAIRRPERMQQETTRLARALVPLLEERTRDGYVYRTDLRLRPDPASTPPAVSVQAAEYYYESAGQNWERAAMIKARPIAGDIEAGDRFMADLRPFIWRRSLDFNAIRDIQSIKRQIDVRQGRGAPSAFEHNVKLGRGGIREVEFFAQTQQLIWGGRNADLRPPETLAALDALAAAGLTDATVAEDLKASYLKLRDIEHRLQMLDDRQTHTTPSAEDAAPFARFAGYESVAAFEADLVETLERVEGHFGELFAEEPTLGGGGALSFTGADEHPDTLSTIADMGFKDPEKVSRAIRGWHHGRVRAARDRRAREILTEITPDLLRRFGETRDPDRSFAAFEKFVAGLPEGVQLFSLLEANRGLLDFLARSLGRSAYLAELIGRRPHVIDAALSDDFMAPPGDKAAFFEEMARELEDALDLQDTLDGARRWLNDLRLSVGVQTLEGRLSPADASGAIADAADVVAETMLNGVYEEFRAGHGDIEGGAYGVIAYGKWGSRERTIGSDLDLVAVYDAPEDARSDGRRSLPAPVYYMRLTQRLITAMTTMTGEGRLFEVDLRLRPSGEDGPVAVRFEALAQYLNETAWTWELMALSRARYAIGDRGLGERIEGLRDAMLKQAASRPDVLADVAAMRRRIAEAKPAGGPWDIRRRPGGIVDVEFIAQGLSLLHGDEAAVRAARRPEDQLRALAGCGAISADRAEALAAAAKFWLAAQWVIRLVGLDEDGGDEAAHPDTRATFALALGYSDYEELIERREGLAEMASAAYQEIFAEASRTPEQDDN